jgi:hypothetical protein
LFLNQDVETDVEPEQVEDFLRRHFPRLVACFWIRNGHETKVERWIIQLFQTVPVSTVSVLLRGAVSTPIDTGESQMEEDFWEAHSAIRPLIHLAFTDGLLGKWQTPKAPLHSVSALGNSVIVNLDAEEAQSKGLITEFCQIVRHYSPLSVDRAMLLFLNSEGEVALRTFLRNVSISPKLKLH